jgi:hypothetical protein
MPGGKSIEMAVRRERSRHPSAALAMTVAAATLATPASGAARVQDQVTFRGGIDLVTAAVAVRDKKGKVVRDLKQADFEIIDAGVCVRSRHSRPASRR